MKRDVISILDLKDDIEEIINLGLEIKRKVKSGGSANGIGERFLGMIFEKSSTGTRISFEIAMRVLGGHAIFLNGKDLQFGKKESIEDVAKMLSGYVDAIVYRACDHNSVIELARHAKVPVINGLDNEEHPCQVLADFLTIKEKKERLGGINFAYIGEGNNSIAHSYLLGCAMVGMNILVISPKEHWPKDFYLQKAKDIAKGSRVEITDSMDALNKDIEVVATDSRMLMEWEEKGNFRGFAVDENVAKRVSPNAIFLHSTLDQHRAVNGAVESIMFDDAENRVWAQAALLRRVLLGGKSSSMWH